MPTAMFCKKSSDKTLMGWGGSSERAVGRHTTVLKRRE